MVEDEQGVYLHQDFKKIYSLDCYQSRWNALMLSDYCWFVIHDYLKVHKKKISFYSCGSLFYSSVKTHFGS